MKSNELPSGYGATVIHPGDRVLISFYGEMTAQQADQMRAALEEIFPDVVFVMMDRVASVVVQRADP